MDKSNKSRISCRKGGLHSQSTTLELKPTTAHVMASTVLQTGLAVVALSGLIEINSDGAAPHTSPAPLFVSSCLEILQYWMHMIVKRLSV